MTRVSYASIYNAAYRRRGLTVDSWVCRVLRRRRPVPKLEQVIGHLWTMRRTQSIGRSMTGSAEEALRRAERLVFLAKMMSLRKLQRCIGRYLWRPGGPLAARHLRLSWNVIHV